MNNEPVIAYINKDDGLVCAKCYRPFKTLTDEEIQDLWAEMDWSGQPELDFARAILRKAQNERK